MPIRSDKEVNDIASIRILLEQRKREREYRDQARFTIAAFMVIAAIVMLAAL
jgi:hypothetical protein